MELWWLSHCRFINCAFLSLNTNITFLIFNLIFEWSWWNPMMSILINLLILRLVLIKIYFLQIFQSNRVLVRRHMVTRVFWLRIFFMVTSMRFWSIVLQFFVKRTQFKLKSSIFLKESLPVVWGRWYSLKTIILQGLGFIH